ncbi:MAG: hypothetical protein ACLVB5_14635 [Christensenellales bacterium]
MAEIGNRKERLRDYASFPKISIYRAQRSQQVAASRLGCFASLSRPQKGAARLDPPLNPLRTPTTSLKQTQGYATLDPELQGAARAKQKEPW